MLLPSLLLIPALVGCTPTPGGGDTGSSDALHTLTLARSIADKGVGRWPADVLLEDWMQTVWVFGLLRLDQATGEGAYQDYATTWMSGWLPDFDGGASPMVSSDSTSPAIIAAMLDQPGFAPITTAADSYIATAPRTDSGAIEHWTDQAPFGVPDQVWIDSQFMLGEYLLQRAAHDPEPAGQQAMLTFTEQYLAVSALCRDGTDQLYRHAWDEAGGENIPTDAVYWARGNAWVLVVGVEALTLLGDQAPAELSQAVIAHATAIAAVQDPDSGLWNTVMGLPRGPDPADYLETSASALLAAALAQGVTAGVLPAELGAGVPAAVAGVQARVSYDGDQPVVTGTSFGTNPGSYDDYVSVPQVDDLILGVGAVLVLLAETDGWPLEESP